MNDTKIRQRMEKYIKQHEAEANQNYGYMDFEEHATPTNKALAKNIHKNFNAMSSDGLKNTVIKCMTEKQIKKIIMEFELRHYRPVSKGDMSLEKFIKKALRVLSRYQCKAGGYYIEDTKWTVHRSNSDDYEVEDYQTLLVNSIDIKDHEDNETIEYMKNIVEYLNCLSDNIEVEQDVYDPEKYDIIWLLLWFTDKNIKDEDPDIDL